MLLTRRGYQISKSILNNKELNEIKEELIVIPKMAPPYNIDTEPINLLHQTEKNIFVPRYYGLEKFGEVESCIKSKNIDISFNAELKDKQKPIVEDIMKQLKETNGGIITLPCGYGKTVIALYIAAQLKLKTMILVHKEALKDQWIERIKQFIGDIKIGEVQSNKVETDADIIVGMIQTISQKDYKGINMENIFKDIGLLIVDECHHIASRIFSKCLYKICADYTIGLSATPDRKDGLTNIIHWYLGPQLVRIDDRKCLETMAYQINYFANDDLFEVKNKYFRGKYTIDTVKMTSNMCEIESRNKMIRDIIVKLLENPKRNIIILSGRIEHIDKLKEMVDEKLKEKEMNIETKKYIGKCKKEERVDAENDGRVIFASYSIASEGLDIPRLNTIILATPQKDVKQSVGRIMRKIHDEDCNPLIIDINDQIPPFSNYGISKVKLYKKSEYHIRLFDIEDDIKDFNIFNQDYITKECNEEIKCYECCENEYGIIEE